MKYLLSFLLIINYTYANEEEAIKTIKAYGKALKKELKAGLKESPVKAVEVCNLKAPLIAKQVSNRNHLIGRVSLKNRNPDNIPRPWMLTTITKYHNKEITKPFTVRNLENNKKGLLKPIYTDSFCLKCHGKEISSDIQKVINEKYPKDKATGYSAGDIRGFFWVEY